MTSLAVSSADIPNPMSVVLYPKVVESSHVEKLIDDWSDVSEAQGMMELCDRTGHVIALLKKMKMGMKGAKSDDLSDRIGLLSEAILKKLERLDESQIKAFKARIVSNSILVPNNEYVFNFKRGFEQKIRQESHEYEGAFKLIEPLFNFVITFERTKDERRRKIARSNKMPFTSNLKLKLARIQAIKYDTFDKIINGDRIDRFQYNQGIIVPDSEESDEMIPLRNVDEITSRYLSVTSLLLMTLVSRRQRQVAVKELTERLNRGEITLNAFGKDPVRKVLNIFTKEERFKIHNFHLENCFLDISCLKGFPNITHLTLSYCQVEDKFAPPIFPKGLKNITLKRCALDGFGFFDRCAGIENLTIEDCKDHRKDTLRDFSPILNHRDSLKSFNLKMDMTPGNADYVSHCKKFITGLNLHKQASSVNLSMLEEYPKLNDLNVSCCQWFDNIAFLSGSQIKHLDLSWCKKVRKFDVIQTLNLETLKLRGCEVSDFGFLKPDLVSLDLSRCPIVELGFLLRCLNLQTLIIDNCIGVTDLSCIVHCPNIKQLSLKGCLNIADLDLLKECKHLQNLDLEDCNQFITNDLLFLFEMPALKSVNLKRTKANRTLIQALRAKGIAVTV